MEFSSINGDIKTRFFRMIAANWKEIATILHHADCKVQNIECNQRTVEACARALFSELHEEGGQSFTVQKVCKTLRNAGKISYAEFLEDNCNLQPSITQIKTHAFSQNSDVKEVPTLGNFINSQNEEVKIRFILFCRDTEKEKFATFLLNQGNLKHELGAIRYNEILEQEKKCLGLSVRDALKACINYSIFKTDMTLSDFMRTVSLQFNVRGCFDQVVFLINEYQESLKASEEKKKDDFSKDEELLKWFSSIHPKSAPDALRRLKAERVYSLTDLKRLDEKMQRRVLQSVYGNNPMLQNDALDNLKE